MLPETKSKNEKPLSKEEADSAIRILNTIIEHLTDVKEDIKKQMNS